MNKSTTINNAVLEEPIFSRELEDIASWTAVPGELLPSLVRRASGAPSGAVSTSAVTPRRLATHRAALLP